jgi:hypothetical protein
MCACVDNQQSCGVVIARLRSSVQSLLHHCRDLLQSTYSYLMEDREPTSYHNVLIGSGILPLSSLLFIALFCWSHPQPPHYYRFVCMD